MVDNKTACTLDNDALSYYVYTPNTRLRPAWCDLWNQYRGFGRKYIRQRDCCSCIAYRGWRSKHFLWQMVYRCKEVNIFDTEKNKNIVFFILRNKITRNPIFQVFE